MKKGIRPLEQKIVLAEKQIREGKELTEEQYRKLSSIASALINDKSKKVKNLQERIIRVKNSHHTIRYNNHIKELEAAHDRLKKELINPSISEEKKRQLVGEVGEISEILQFLQR